MVKLLFWPAIFLSIGISILGVIIRKPSLLIIGSVLAFPFSWYLGASPRFEIFGFFLPLFQIVGAFVVYKKVFWAGWLSLLPLIGLSSWLALAVISQ